MNIYEYKNTGLMCVKQYLKLPWGVTNKSNRQNINKEINTFFKKSMSNKFELVQISRNSHTTQTTYSFKYVKNIVSTKMPQ